MENIKAITTQVKARSAEEALAYFEGPGHRSNFMVQEIDK